MPRMSHCYARIVINYYVRLVSVSVVSVNVVSQSTQSARRNILRHVFARQRAATRGETRGREAADGWTTNNMSVTQSHSTNIKHGQGVARGSGMLACISTCDSVSFCAHY